MSSAKKYWNPVSINVGSKCQNGAFWDTNIIANVAFEINEHSVG